MYLEHGATDEVFGTDMEVFREIEREAALGAAVVLAKVDL